MKNLKSRLLSLLVPLCLFLTACANPLNYDVNEKDGITRIAITLPGGNKGKSRVVGDPAGMEYELTFEGPNGQTFTETAFGGQTVIVRVEPGSWTIKVRSYDPGTGVDEAKGEVLSFDVKEGQTNNPSIQMRFVQTAPIDLYLASAAGGLSASNPVSLHLDMTLDAVAWTALLTAIDGYTKFVDLNLSVCTGSGTGAGLRGDGTFDPDSGVTTGKSRIVSLALPDATSIVGGFNGFTALKSFNLPENTTSIGEKAFYNCANLELSSLPANLTTIGDSAFQSCGNLALTSLPANLTTIGQYAFQTCAKLALTYLPANLTTIGDSAFNACKSLALTSLPDDLKKIGNGVFEGCTKLALTSLPAGLEEIGDSAFNGCTSLALTSLPDSLTTIGFHTFDGCTSLALISLPATTIDRYAFYGCTGLTTLDLSNVIQIRNYAFVNCTSLVSVKLRDGLTFSSPTFDGDLDSVYSGVGGGAGTYVRDNGSDMTWEKLP